MSRRSRLALAAATFAVVGLVVVLACAGIVWAAPASSPAGATTALGAAAPGYGWVIQLRGAISKDLTYRQFAAVAAEKGVGASVAFGTDTWAGVPLWRLVGLVDDKHPKTFSDSLAKKGYFVQVVGLDGSAAILKSTDSSWVHSHTAIVADERDGAPLAFGSISSGSSGANWLPSWPAQLVGPTLTDAQKVGGIVKIIDYKPGAHPPTRPALQPSWIQQVRGAARVDCSAAQFRKLASAHAAGWTDTSVDPHVTYTGTPLWRLVALADGGSPATLNLDWLGLGYTVDVCGMGATAGGADAPTKVTFPSTAFAGTSGVVIADREDQPLSQLTPTQGNLVQQPDTSYAWVPTWPARVGGSGVTADQSNGGVARVVLEKPVVPGYLKPLVLKGRRTVKVAFLDFPTPATWDGTKAGNINPTLRAVYRGQTLCKLIGMVDDKHPKTFNAKLARKGYKIEFVASDGYVWTISSKTIVGKKDWLVASLKDGKAMTADEGPYRYVGSFIKPFYGKPSVYKLVEIKLIF